MARADRATRDATARAPSARAARRMIVKEFALRECFATLDASARGTIVVRAFLDRLRADAAMTDALQDATEAFTTTEMLDGVFDALEEAATRTVGVEEFLELFRISAIEANKRARATMRAAKRENKREKKKKNKAVGGGGTNAAVKEETKGETKARAGENGATSAEGAGEDAPEIEARAGQSAEEKTAVPAPLPAPRAPAPPPAPQAPVQVVVDGNYLKQVFELIDYDGNGEVTLVEFLSALHSNPEIGALLDEGTPTGDDVSNVVSEVFSRMDADQNKSVTFEEFVQYFTVQQNAHSNHALNKLSREDKKALLLSFDKAKVRSMSAFKRGIRFVSKQALKAGLRTSEKEKKEENMSKIPDSDLLVLKSYLRDVYKIVDYEKNERIVLQEFLDELSESPNIALALDVGSDISHGADKTKKMVAVIFKAMSIDAKRVVTFPEFVNYFIKITSDYFNSDSPLSRQSVVSESRSASANSTIAAFVGELFKFENKAPPPAPVAEERVASQNASRPHGDDDYMDGLVYGDDENEDLDHTVHLLRHELQQMNAVLEENQHQKKMNNALRLKLNVLTHMYAKQSAEFQALIDSMK